MSAPHNAGPFPTLADLDLGASARVTGLDGDSTTQNRLIAMGFVSGTDVRLESLAPMGDPRIYNLLGYRLTLRNDDARKVLVDLPLL